MSRSPFEGLGAADIDRDALELAWVTGSEEDRRELERLADVMRHGIARDRRPLLEPPTGARADGPIRLGRVIHGSDVRDLGWAGITTDELCRHMLIVGRTGSGKTTLAVGVLRRLMEMGTSWVALDHKRSLRSLLGVDLPAPVHVCALGRHLNAALRFNPLHPPPGVPFETHRRQVVELLCDSWFAGDGVAALLDRAIVRASGSVAGGVPTFLEVRRAVEGMMLRDREALWRQSALRILEQVTTGQLGRVLNTRRDARTLDLLPQRCTVLELDGLSAVDSAFLVGHILRYLASGMLGEKSRERLQMVVFCDEAHHVLRKHDSGRESIAETLMREAREVGLGMILATQSFQGLSGVAIANASTLVSMHLTHRSDIHAAAQGLLLKDEQRDLLSLLGTGEAVVRRSEAWQRPIHIRVPPSHMPKGTISDTHITRAFLLGPYSQASLTEAGVASESPATVTLRASSAGSTDVGGVRPPMSMRGAVWGIPRADKEQSSGGTDRFEPTDQEALGQVVETIPEVVDGPTHRGSSVAEIDGTELPPEAIALLKHVGAHPLVGVAARYLAVGLSRRKGDAAKKHLIAEKMVVPVDVVTPDGKTVLLAATDAGREWLTRHRCDIAPVRGSPLHMWWQETCAGFLKDLGWAVTIEHVIGGHAFDVHATRGDSSLLLEVETGRSSWLHNLQMLGVQDAEHRAVLWLDRAQVGRAIAASPSGVRVLTPTTLLAWLAEVSGGGVQGGMSSVASQ